MDWIVAFCPLPALHWRGDKNGRSRERIINKKVENEQKLPERQRLLEKKLLEKKTLNCDNPTLTRHIKSRFVTHGGIAATKIWITRRVDGGDVGDDSGDDGGDDGDDGGDDGSDGGEDGGDEYYIIDDIIYYII